MKLAIVIKEILSPPKYTEALNKKQICQKGISNQPTMFYKFALNYECSLPCKFCTADCMKEPFM